MVGLVGPLDHLPARITRQDPREPRAREAGRAGEFRTCRDQERAALSDVAGDVVEIGRGQHALVGVAVEDDQIEVLDLLDEQLARRKGDQREFRDRRTVLLLRRPQDREVDEIDVGVGLQQVAPGTLALVRFAGDQEHAQFLANALDRQDGAVVDRGQLARQRLDLDLDHVRAAMLDLDRQIEGLVGRNGAARGLGAVAAQGDDGRAGPAAFHHLGADGQVLADDPEARRLQELDLTVALVRMSGDEHVQRRLDAEGGERGRDVVDHAVGDHDDAGEPLRRHIGERLSQCGEQLGAVVAGRVRHVDEARLDVGQGAEAALQLGSDLIGHRRPVAERLRAGAIDDHRGDVTHRFAILAHERGVGECGQHQAEHEGAQGRRAPARQEGEDGKQHGDDRERREHRPGQQGREAEAQHEAGPSASGRGVRPPPEAEEGGPRVSEGRERGATGPDTSLPSPDLARGPPSPAEGGGQSARWIRLCLTAPAAPTGPARGPDRPCSCRSACTSRCSRRPGTPSRAGAGRRRPPGRADRPGGRSPRRRRGRCR